MSKQHVVDDADNLLMVIEKVNEDTDNLFCKWIEFEVKVYKNGKELTEDEFSKLDGTVNWYLNNESTTSIGTGKSIILTVDDMPGQCTPYNLCARFCWEKE